MSERPDESVVGIAPPPRKSDKLFRSDSEWITNACVNYTHNPDHLYTNGYRVAARSLAEQVCESQRQQDSLIYPIVYLYRHCIELLLKDVTFTASALLDKELTEQEIKALGRHELNKLWEQLRPLLNAVCECVGNAPFPDEDLEGIDSYIQQLHEHDPDGQRFRYTTVKKQKKKTSNGNTPASEPSLKPDLKLINIRVFANAMETLVDYLDGIEGWFSHLLGEKHEMERSFF